MNETNELILQRSFRHGGGFRWIADVPASFAGPSDTMDAPAASRLQLSEDGIPLGPRHSIHAAIESEGHGRYSHWHDALLFSTSDGTDPNLNGRKYAVFVAAPTLRVLGFGSCHLYDALGSLQIRGMARCIWNAPLPSLTPRETLQLIRFYGGQFQIPDPLHILTVATKPVLNPATAALRGADLVFLEFGSSIDVAYGPVFMMRTQLHSALLTPIGALSRTSHRAALRWYNQGLIKQNESVRRECAEQLLELMPETGLGLESNVARDVVRNARGSAQDAGDVMCTIDKIRQMLDAKAVCVLSAQNAYTPDGRPLNWPGNFPKQLDSICGDLDLPLLHPSRLVAERGGAFALQSDLIHFTPRFLSLLGDEMLAMGRRALRV